MWICSDTLLNQYECSNDFTKDQWEFICQNKINAFAVELFNNKYYCILGCSDNCVRVIYEKNLLYSIKTSASVLCLCPFNKNYSDLTLNLTTRKDKNYMLGLSNGSIVYV